MPRSRGLATPTNIISCCVYSMIIPVLEMSLSQPANFSWFVEGKLAAMGYPNKDGNIRYLAGQGIKTLVNLTRGQSYSESPAAHGLTVHSISIRDFHAPTMEQIEDFLRVADNAKPESVSPHTNTH